MPPPTTITFIGLFDAAGFAEAPSFRGSPHVLHSLESRELNVVKSAIRLLDFSDVDVMHHVPCRGIDRYGTARAFPAHTLHHRHKLIAVDRSIGSLERLINEMHSVVATYRHEVRAFAGLHLVGVDKRSIHR